MAASSVPPRPPLGRRRILEAALTLIDSRGLDDLTMRALGAELGVEAMSIYKHVPGKGAVLDGVVELLLEELSDGGRPLAASDWREALADLAQRLRRLSLSHPLSFSLLSRRSVSAYLVARDVVEQVLQTLIAGGFTREEAVAAVRLVVRFTLGFSFTNPARTARADGPELGSAAPLEDEFPLVAELLGTMGREDQEESLFAIGLAALIRGLVPSDAR